MLQLLQAHRESPVEYIVFFHLQDAPWTLFIHDLSIPLEHGIEATNSLNYALNYDIQDQVVFQQLFRAYRPTETVSTTSA